MPFPKDFLWGAASAAPQIEGAWDEDGRTPSIWDAAPSQKIKRSETPHTACDHYHRYREDVALMREMGLKSYRFSVSWPRVMPEPGKVNPEGLQFYVDLVKELTDSGIEPICTLYHWDLPVWMHKKGGWCSAKVVDHFVEYTKVVVDALSDKVRYWITINEPSCFMGLGYVTGIHAPFQRATALLTGPLTEHILLAHSKAVAILRSHAKRTPMIGVALVAEAYIPETESPDAVQTAYEVTFSMDRAMFSNSWWADPMLSQTAGGVERKLLSRKTVESCPKLDFIGLNVYQPSNYFCGGVHQKTSVPGMPRNTIGFVIKPDVMYWVTRFFYERYRMPIMITENGMANNDFVMSDGKVHDPQRIDFMKGYLGSLGRAVGEGIPVLGYQHWSLIDNFEWAEGYDPRFGLIHVDYATQKRTVKDSGLWYRDVIAANGENL